MAVPTFTDSASAIQYIQAHTLVEADLRSIITQLKTDYMIVDVTASNWKVAIVYSGASGSSVDALEYTSDIAETLGKNSGKEALTIGQTTAGEVLDSDVFKIAMKNATGSEANANKVMYGVLDSSGNRIQEGIWDDLSKTMAPHIKVPVETITPFAKNGGTYSASELKLLLNNTDIPTIGGVSHTNFLTEFNSLKASIGEANALIKIRGYISDLSYAHLHQLHYGTDATGRLAVGADKSFFHGTAGLDGIPLPDNSTEIGAVSKYFGNLDLPRLDSLAATAQFLGKYHVIDKIGTAGDVLAFSAALTTAIQLYDSNEKDAAQQTMLDWAIDLSGGIAGGIAGTRVVAILIGIASLVGFTPPGLVASALLFSGAALGSILGGNIHHLLPTWAELTGEYGQAVRDEMSIRAVYSPLVLDLTGNGVSVSKLGFGAGASTTRFDMDNDGFAERTAWATGGDGLLAVDRNGNGKIDNQSELFGNNAQYADGFLNLRSFDSNHDSRITAADTDFSKLRVWVDANSNGLTEADELKTLDDLKITQINLNATQYVDIFGQPNKLLNENQITAGSAFVMNGVGRVVQDVWFRTDSMDTRNTADYTLDVRTLFLPTLKGFGELNDLHVAMSQDTALLTLVQDFVANWSPARFAAPGALNTDVQAILFKWAHVDTVAVNARGPYLDARIIGFVEKLTGEPFTNQQLASDGSWANMAYQEAFAALKAFLIIQSGGQALFDQKPVYNFAIGDVTAGTISDASIAALKAQALASGNASAYWHEAADFFLHVKNPGAFTAAENLALDHAMTDSGYATTWQGLLASMLPNPDITSIQAPVTIFDGTNLADHLVGDQGPNMLLAAGGDDVLIGRLGSDILNGGLGNDTYLYRAGDGADVIGEDGGNDTLKIEGAYTLSDIRLVRHIDPGTVNSLDILLKGQVIMTVENQFLGGGNSLETILLDDGTSLKLTGFKNVNGTDGNDTLNGLDFSAVAKSDALYGGSGDDTLNGKSGNDYLYGGAGNDTYLYASAGSGRDVVSDFEGVDSLVLASVYTPANISLVRSGLTDLIVKSGNTELMLIKDQFTANGSVEFIKFSSGAPLDLLTYAHTLNGAAGDDKLYGVSFGAGGDKLYGLAGKDYLAGYSGDDTLSGGAGNDTVDAGVGNDTVVYESGLDTFYDGGGTDVISVTNPALTASSVTLRRDVYNQYHLDVLLNGVQAFSLQDQFREGLHFETIKFVDGSIFNLMAVQYTANGTPGDDNLPGIGFGGNPNDIINGGDGNDTIYGLQGNDVMAGGKGSDRLFGAAGDDTYKINANEGADIINDESGSDTIQFGAGFSAANMTLLRDTVSTNLKILFGGVLAATVENHFSMDMNIETLKFVNEPAFDLAGYAFTRNGTNNSDVLFGHGGKDILNGVNGDDILGGGAGNDMLKGGAGNDTLYGDAGNDTLDGGAGQDNQCGGKGDDVYMFSAGFGGLNTWDYILEQPGEGNDTIKFLNLKSTDMYSIEYGASLLIQSKIQSADTIFIDGTGDTDVSQRIEKIVFSDGVIWNMAAGLTIQDNNESHTIYGSAKNDVLKGNGGDDIIYGLSGSDTLNGGTGADMFTFQRTYAFNGVDTIMDFSVAQNDTINLQGMLEGYIRDTSPIADFVQIMTIGSDSILKVDVDGGADNFLPIANLIGVMNLSVTDSQHLIV